MVQPFLVQTRSWAIMAACVLVDRLGWVLQFALGLLAFFILIFKRYQVRVLSQPFHKAVFVIVAPMPETCGMKPEGLVGRVMC